MPDTNKTLYLVPTPIGNLGDITLRALEVLRMVDAIACEDTRHSRKLLTHFGIEKPLLRLDAHTIAQRAPGVLAAHQRLAFVSDAGSPGLSDPGAELVTLALAQNFRVEALPGPTALVPALTLSGLPNARFAFYGFLPRAGRERRQDLQAIANATSTSVVYESPKRIAETLSELAALCDPTRQCAVARELSKLHEEVFRGTLQAAQTWASRGVRGELVLVVGPNERPVHDKTQTDWENEGRRLAAQGLDGREIRTALQAQGLERNRAYAVALLVQQTTP